MCECVETYETLHKKTKKVHKVTAHKAATMHTDLRKRQLLDEFVRFKV